ncbi:MAG: hypothetical protein SFV19_00435 [Rhodospirillaceae bacterium]|nr:hypothetical protein [Rhodospirillaceae bacterium]
MPNTLFAALILAASAAGLAAAQETPPANAIDTGSELPSYMIPNIPEAAEAYYAPDSYHLIAQTRDPDAVKTPFGGPGALTYIFTDDGKKVWRVNDRGQDACSFFFPDMKRVVWTSTRDNMTMPVGNWSDSNQYPQGGELYSSDLDGRNVKRLTNNKYYEAEVSVSPDGQWIAFGRQINRNMDIWVMKSDGSEERQVTRTADWQEGAPFFMKDNHTIIFRAWRGEDYGKVKPTPMTIFTIGKDGTNWRRHTTDRGMNWHPFPAPDGRHYVYVRALSETNWEIYLGDLAGGPHRRLTHNDKIDILANVSPDGKKMNWGRATGERFMSNIKTFIMDVSSLNIGPENYVPFDPNWGEAMPAASRKSGTN